jgi:hypothetical protein
MHNETSPKIPPGPIGRSQSASPLTSFAPGDKRNASVSAGCHSPAELAETLHELIKESEAVLANGQSAIRRSFEKLESIAALEQHNARCVQRSQIALAASARALRGARD